MAMSNVILFVWELGDSYSCGYVSLVILLYEGDWIDSSSFGHVHCNIVMCGNWGIVARVVMFHCETVVRGNWRIVAQVVMFHCETVVCGNWGIIALVDMFH